MSGVDVSVLQSVYSTLCRTTIKGFGGKSIGLLGSTALLCNNICRYGLLLTLELTYLTVFPMFTLHFFVPQRWHGGYTHHVSAIWLGVPFDYFHISQHYFVFCCPISDQMHQLD